MAARSAAAGTRKLPRSLKVNGLGYWALVAQIGNCLLAGLWLIINATDNKP